VARVMKSYEIAAPAHIAREAWRQFVHAGEFLPELQDVRFDPLDEHRSRLRVTGLLDADTLAIDAVVQRFRNELARQGLNYSR
jgi:hypothetical protein